jgi:NAD(P)-dependent dehydrogenase (short-subunit alcohol dehydrogenase family)
MSIKGNQTVARLKDKIALITGAARGIGAETARLFVKEGARVIVADILDQEGKTLVQALGAQAEYFHLDVSKESEWQKLTSHIQDRYQKIDVLFNNAGVIGVGHPFENQDPEHASLETWHHIHEVNLDGVFLGCKYGIALMKNHGGSIINMSSRSGVVGVPTLCGYASSKAAVRNHSKSVALYCASQGYKIRCNSLLPASILTPLWEPLFGEDREAAIAQMAASIPLGHMGDPIDVAYAALYLGSDESAFITGTELTLDGGILAGSASAPASSVKQLKK